VILKDIKGVPNLGKLGNKNIRLEPININHLKMILRKIKSMAEPQKNLVFLN
jgi:hypothetical protein